MTPPSLLISSPANPRIRRAIKLRQRSHRDELGLLLIEGYREVKRALDNGHIPTDLFFCPELFRGKNEGDILSRSEEAGVQLLQCTRPVFEKISYRDRPEGLLAIAPQVRCPLTSVVVRERPLVVVAEAIEKPGNLGTILRSADATGVTAVLVCDRCTDINNPNVVRASIGTLFSLPVVETTSAEALVWLRAHKIQIVAASPHATQKYTEVDLRGPTAIVVGTEQYGLSPTWLEAAHVRVRIPMLGQADSLNVAAATTILLYEVVRQRNLG